MTGPPQPNVYMPALQGLTPYVMPPSVFDTLIGAYGIRMAWCRSHSCPCVYGGSIPGSPDPQCTSCGGRGVYWDQPLGPFQTLLTFIRHGPTPDEPGTMMDQDQGLLLNGEPTLTIPYSGTYVQQSTVWQEAGVYDLFVEIDAISRFNANLQVGGNMNVPYPQAVTIAPTGAVTTYDAVTHSVVSGVSYAVSGITVTPSGLATGTNYTVDFEAAPCYVAYRIAGMPAHVRPFGGLNYPRRFRLQTLDLWTRQKGGSDNIPYIQAGT